MKALNQDICLLLGEVGLFLVNYQIEFISEILQNEKQEQKTNSQGEQFKSIQSMEKELSLDFMKIV